MAYHQPVSLPWLFVCSLLVLGAASAIRGLRIPAESAAGRYLGSGVVQRSVVPAALEAMQADEAPDLAPEVSPGGHWLGLGKRAREQQDYDLDESGDDAASRFTPYVSVGVLSNMQQFFDSLRSNLDSLEELPTEEKELLLGRAAVNSNPALTSSSNVINNNNNNNNGEASKPGSSTSSSSVTSHSSRNRLVSDHRTSRPTATAAYLHALRSHKPSHKLRNFVAQVEPTELRGSNSYDPAWLWAGLGRRRR